MPQVLLQDSGELLPVRSLSAIVSDVDKSSFKKELSDHLFWDVDRTSVDVDAHECFLIPRIMDRGRLGDVEAAWGYYGEERVKEALTTASSLNKKTIAFFANQFGLAPESFRAHRVQTGTWGQ